MTKMSDDSIKTQREGTKTCELPVTQIILYLNSTKKEHVQRFVQEGEAPGHRKMGLKIFECSKIRGKSSIFT